MKREEALECLFRSVQSTDHGDRRVYASPLKIDLGSVVELDRDSSSVRKLFLQSDGQESVELVKRAHCKILCSPCFSRHGERDISDYKVCVADDIFWSAN